MSEDEEEFNFELSGLIYLCSSGSLASTGHGLRLPAEIAAGRRGFPAANEIRDLYIYRCLKSTLQPFLNRIHPSNFHMYFKLVLGEFLKFLAYFTTNYTVVAISTASLSHLRTMLPKSRCQPLPAQRPNHAT